MQRQVAMTGQLTPCPGVGCNRQPKHWLDMRQSGLHHLECSPCGNRTPKYPTFQQAVEAWEAQSIEPIKVK